MQIGNIYAYVERGEREKVRKKIQETETKGRDEYKRKCRDRFFWLNVKKRHRVND